MKARSIGKYWSVLVYGVFLLGGMITFPNRAMAPPPFEKTPKAVKDLYDQRKEPVTPKPPIGPIQISGHVRVPDGRGLPKVKIQLYELPERGEKRFVKETETTSAGYYNIQLGETWGGKKVGLFAKYAQFGVGEHFSPSEHRFQITSAITETRNFRYNGPLPDLMVPQPEMSIAAVAAMGFEVRGGVCYFLIAVWNRGGVESGPFKVKVKYWDRPGGPQLFKEKIQPVSSISPGNYKAVEVELGPGTLEDKKLGALESGTGRYAVSSVQVDCEDSVIESNEDNNRLPW